MVKKKSYSVGELWGDVLEGKGSNLILVEKRLGHRPELVNSIQCSHSLPRVCVGVRITLGIGKCDDTKTENMGAVQGYVIYSTSLWAQEDTRIVAAI